MKTKKYRVYFESGFKIDIDLDVTIGDIANYIAEGKVSKIRNNLDVYNSIINWKKVVIVEKIE